MNHLSKHCILGLILFSISVLCIFSSCGDDEGTTTPCTSPSYSSDIRPIIVESCALVGCHVAGFADGDYSSYQGVKANADSGTLGAQITSGDMPPANSPGPTNLSNAEIDLINCWIADGAPNN